MIMVEMMVKMTTKKIGEKGSHIKRLPVLFGINDLFLYVDYFAT